MTLQQMIQEIEAREDSVLHEYRALRDLDPNDHYWEQMLRPELLMREGRLFETPW